MTCLQMQNTNICTVTPTALNIHIVCHMPRDIPICSDIYQHLYSGRQRHMPAHTHVTHMYTHRNKSVFTCPLHRALSTPCAHRECISLTSSVSLRVSALDGLCVCAPSLGHFLCMAASTCVWILLHIRVFTRGYASALVVHLKTVNINPYLTPYTAVNSKWIRDPPVRQKDNTTSGRKDLCDLGVGRDLLGRTPL